MEIFQKVIMPEFTRRGELFSFVCPPEKPYIEVWHTHEAGFGARIMRQSTRTGKAKRSYIYRSKVDGKDHKAVLGTFDELDYDDALDQIRVRKLQKSAASLGQPVTKRVPTLAEALERYLENKADTLSDSTVTDYRRKWAILDGDAMARASDKEKFTEKKRLTELDSEWWLAKYQSVARMNGRASAIGLYRTAHAIYEHFIGLDYIVKNPLKFVKASTSIKKAPPSTKQVPAKDLPALWTWLTTTAQPATRDFCFVALFSGLRASVIGGLRWEQVNVEKRTYIVPAEERGNKAKTLLEMPIADELWTRVFEPRLRARRENQPWVISSAKKAGAPAKDVKSAMIGLDAHTGIDCSPHVLRRTFATLAQIATGDALLVSRMLTHTNKGAAGAAPAVTGGYINFEVDTLRDGLNETAAEILRRCNEVGASQVQGGTTSDKSR